MEKIMVQLHTEENDMLSVMRWDGFKKVSISVWRKYGYMQTVLTDEEVKELIELLQEALES